MREWLKAARLRSELTMKQIAEKLGISESYYCSIENGDRQRNMDITLAAKLADILGVDIKDILIAEEDLRAKIA